MMKYIRTCNYRQVLHLKKIFGFRHINDCNYILDCFPATEVNLPEPLNVSSAKLDMLIQRANTSR